MSVSPDELQQTLRDLPKIGTLVKAHAYREVWRFEFGGKPYYLKFYPRDGQTMKRMIRGGPALHRGGDATAFPVESASVPRRSPHRPRPARVPALGHT